MWIDGISKHAMGSKYRCVYITMESDMRVFTLTCTLKSLMISAISAWNGTTEDKCIVTFNPSSGTVRQGCSIR